VSFELIFTATYNEAENIRAWVQEVSNARPDSDLLIVDDSSPDGTGTILRSLQKAFPRLTLIERTGKFGLASAHRLAIRYAVDNGYQVLVTMDADSSHQPSQIGSVVDGLRRSDFCIGTRYRGGSHQASRFRRLLSHVANRLAMIALRTGLSEYTTSFRAFSPRAMQTIDTQEFPDGGYAFFIECVNTIALSGCRMTEVPIDFLDRAHGVSKIPKSQVFLSARALAALALNRNAQRARTASLTSRYALARINCPTCGQATLVSAPKGYQCLQCGTATANA
jgi:glycosyltransferase involved in cell wall biosynthesis